MQERKIARMFVKETEGCFHLDGANKLLFSVSDFLRLNNVADTPERRAIANDEFRRQFPDIAILEEWN